MIRRRIAWFVYMAAAKICRNLWQGTCGDCGCPIGITESYHIEYWNDPRFDGEGDGICTYCRSC